MSYRELAKFNRTEGKRGNFVGLLGVVDILSPKAKKAMYGAILTRGRINQKTWNGCAFNAAGRQLDSNTYIKSPTEAATLFEMLPADVSKFIYFWDNYRATNPTDDLKRAILEVGLETPPNAFEFGEYNRRAQEKKNSRRRILRVYTSEETRIKEEFEKVVAGLDINASSLSNDETALLNDIGTATEMLAGIN